MQTSTNTYSFYTSLIELKQSSLFICTSGNSIIQVQSITDRPYNCIKMVNQFTPIIVYNATYIYFFHRTKLVDPALQVEVSGKWESHIITSIESNHSPHVHVKIRHSLIL